MAIHGIAGIVFRDRQRPAGPELARRMLRASESDATICVRSNATLGSPVLAPLREGIVNEDGSKAIAFSGELYNRQELRATLVEKGHVFRSDSDAETALHAFEQYGTQVPLHLRGVFAFALFDQAANALTLVRDRLGMKPLFYARLNPGKAEEALLFASEVKSLLAEPSFDRGVDLMALNHYLTFQYVPHPWSIFRGAHKVPPAHCLTYREGVIRTERYWDLQYQPKSQVTEDEAVEQAMAQVDEALRIRLAGESKMGVLLSGGVDSSAMVAMIRQHVPGDLHTFSVGFREQDFDELPYARQVARQFDTKHEEYVVKADTLESLGELAWHYDEPVADSSAIATFHVIRKASEQVGVAFLGDGGDESFLGYERYRGFPIFNTYLKIPRVLRAISDSPFAAMSRAMPWFTKMELLSYVNRVSLMSEEERYVQTMVYFREYQKPRLFAPAHRAILRQPAGNSEELTLALLRKSRQDSFAERKPYSDIMSYLPGALIPKVERAAIANGIPCRAPMLDERVMEYCAKLPPELKLKNGTLKYLLKKGVLRYFPEEFLNRPKQGFGVPVGNWFRDDLRKFTEDFLLGSTASNRGFFDMAYVRRIFEQHASGAQNHAPRLWVLTVLEAWCRTFLDRPDALQQGPTSFK